MSRSSIKTVQRVFVPSPQARISDGAQGMMDDDLLSEDEIDDTDLPQTRLEMLHEFATTGGDISHLLELSQVNQLGTDAVRQWQADQGSRAKWTEMAERSLAIAAQEDDSGDGQKDFPWSNASDIHYPLLTTASQQFAARAEPALIKGDKVVGVKVFMPPVVHTPTIDTAKAAPQPQDPQQAQAATQAIQGQEQADAQHGLMLQARQKRGERVKQYLNWLIFYKMDNWQGETDQLLHEIPITGAAFKKIYMGTTGLCSDYVSALRLTVHSDTKSLNRCPRVTQDFEVYPYEIEDRKRAGIYRDITLPDTTSDPERPRTFIEQHTLADLDGDGLSEPYIVTVDVESRQTMRVEPAYGPDDIIINERSGKVVRIDRWQAFSPFLFLPDPKGSFYGIGFGKLLQTILESIDTTMNQLIDAGTAQIAGGGFIGSGVRLQGGGQGGAAYFRPGEYQMVSTSGATLRDAIWERTVPGPSQVAFSLLEMLLASAKDIASVKDVITGNTPATAPVGTTLALQDQALQVFSSIYKRIYRGFATEFRLMYLTLKRFGGDRERKEYNELTGGDFDADFTGDGTDIQPVADPTVVTKMQMVSRIQTLLQLAENPVGQAAGMTQPQQAQAIIMESLEALDWDRPERFVGAIAPNPIMEAKAADMQAAAQLKSAQAQTQGSAANLDKAKALREVGLAAKDTHSIHQTIDAIHQTGSLQPPPEPSQGSPNGQIPAGPPVLASPPIA